MAHCCITAISSVMLMVSIWYGSYILAVLDPGQVLCLGFGYELINGTDQSLQVFCMKLYLMIILIGAEWLSPCMMMSAFWGNFSSVCTHHCVLSVCFIMVSLKWGHIMKRNLVPGINKEPYLSNYAFWRCGTIPWLYTSVLHGLQRLVSDFDDKNHGIGW